MTGKLTENRTKLRATAVVASSQRRGAAAPSTYAPPSRSTATHRFAAPAIARQVHVKSVGAFVPSLTRKAFEKHGFAAATLITDWREIAGAALASYTLPERLKWPRIPGTGATGAESDEGRPGATLVLRVDPARALDVEYRARQIIERINAYFGYRAVAEIRLIQAPVPQDEQAPRKSRHPSAGSHPADAKGVDPLDAALKRLEQRVIGKTAEPA